MAFAELKRLKAKIRQGSATTEEIEKYREMMPDHNDESEDSEARSHHDDQYQEQEQRQQVVPPANENGSSHHPLPVLEAPDAKRQRLMVINSCHTGVAVKKGMGQFQKDGANKLGGPGPVGQGQSSTPRQPPHHPVPASNLALLDALRASKATRGHHQQSKTMFSSVVDQLKTNPQDEEGVRAARRLTGMKGTAAIMSPSAPFALSSATRMGSSSSSSSCNTSTNMSAQHILRRIGNPHRRVVHQMLREQNERVLVEMKRKTIESMSRPSSSGAVATTASTIVAARPSSNS
eukprot:CAMPEP_0113523636 /NCGR_PEP_ID=MMETSP0014_2-20120614/45806_1 /TAXON_ID=2857 /ORGANISM="Nitzschia sp." /LENGTH=290 /DNA_ID=CAMNT_0000421729 /DNA_START=108 /DNA_END=977 /DNA_ORIENTATION=- /assembly_acc=CAM_ASM_000159